MIGSISASRALPRRAVYGASKAGIEHLARSLAAELGPAGFRVNIVAPGVIGTPFLGDDAGPLAEWISERVPIGRIGSPGGGRGKSWASWSSNAPAVPHRGADRRRRRRGGARMTTSPVETVGTPIRFATKAEAVYEEIRRRILRGILPPASPLNQDALAPELGVSVTPGARGDAPARGGGARPGSKRTRSVIVSPLSLDELSEIYDVRLQLDPHAAAVATTKASEADARADRARWRGRRSAAIRSSRRRSTARSTARSMSSRGNGLLIEILDRLWERTDRYRIMLVSTESRREGGRSRAPRDRGGDAVETVARRSRS